MRAYGRNPARGGGSWQIGQNCPIWGVRPRARGSRRRSVFCDRTRIRDTPRVQAATERLHTLERRTGAAIIDIGRTPIDVKERLGYGHVGAWLAAEFGWSQRTAYNFIQVAEQFGVANFASAGQFQPSALYALVSGNVPEPIREEFVARAETGERVPDTAQEPPGSPRTHDRVRHGLRDMAPLQTSAAAEGGAGGHPRQRRKPGYFPHPVNLR